MLICCHGDTCFAKSSLFSRKHLWHCGHVDDIRPPGVTHGAFCPWTKTSPTIVSVVPFEWHLSPSFLAASMRTSRRGQSGSASGVGHTPLAQGTHLWHRNDSHHRRSEASWWSCDELANNTTGWLSSLREPQAVVTVTWEQPPPSDPRCSPDDFWRRGGRLPPVPGKEDAISSLYLPQN